MKMLRVFLLFAISISVSAQSLLPPPCDRWWRTVGGKEFAARYNAIGYPGFGVCTPKERKAYRKAVAKPKRVAGTPTKED